MKSFSEQIDDFLENQEEQLRPIFKQIDKIAEKNQIRVIQAMQNASLSERHFLPATGYGYDDQGREAVETIFAEILKAEKALVRPHINSGTHAIACALYGNLRPGDELLSITGSPYNTVVSFIGDQNQNPGMGTLSELGVHYKQIDLSDDNTIDIETVLNSITDKTKMIYLQRSTGYSWRPALTLEEIGEAVQKIKEKFPDIIIFLDNCYGEFISDKEPLEYGVDLIAGSLIKNAGGGIAPTGGYVAGKKELVDRAAARLSAPGIAGETGATLTWPKTVLQGLFLAPTIVAAALKNAILCASVFKDLGFPVCPDITANRSDIIQSIELGDPDKLILFCKAIQEAAPVDSFVTPEPWDMPGYEEPVIMAAGAFVQGSSIELSADGPIREPYIVYYQGGLTYAHGKYGIKLALQRLSEENYITLKE